MSTLDKCGIFASLLGATISEVALGFGYNSEKRFNNPLLLKKDCDQSEEMAAVKQFQNLGPHLGGTMPKLTVCHPSFLDQAWRFCGGELYGYFD
jgi:hypothetical protein